MKWTNEVLDSVYRAKATPGHRQRATPPPLPALAHLGAQRTTPRPLPGRRPPDAAAYLKAWCTSALRSRIKAFTNLVRRIRKHFDAIIAAIQLGLSNSRLEGINAKIRLIQRRGFGIRDVDSLTSMIYLCLGGITIDLPTDRRQSIPVRGS